MLGYIGYMTHLSKRTCTAEVGGRDDDEEHGDPNGDGHVCSSRPVRNDDGASGNLGRQGDGKLIPIIPPNGETERGITAGGRGSAMSEKGTTPSRNEGEAV